MVRSVVSFKSTLSVWTSIVNTRQTSDLYVPSSNLAMYQKGVYYSGIKIYNHLPTAIKDLSGDKNKFKLALKRYLLLNSFYSLEEYVSI